MDGRPRAGAASIAIPDPLVECRRVPQARSSDCCAIIRAPMKAHVTRSLAISLLLFSAHAFAFESDVHYGLTQWLAMQAGFGSEAAQIIATGDQRVESGDMQFVELVLIYACVGKDE